MKKDLQLAYALLRITTGLCLFAHALVRLAGNYAGFQATMAEQFSKTILPNAMTAPVAMLIPPVELILGLLLIIGWRTRLSLIGASLLMMVLIFGSCMLQAWAIVSEQMIYALIYAILIAFRSHNSLCLDQA